MRKEAVLPIFWTLTILRPMSDEGGNGFSRIPILSFPPHLTRGNKELPDMKRATFAVLTLIVLAGLSGCACHQHLPASCVGGDCSACPGPDGCSCGQAQPGCCQAGQAGCGEATPACGACEAPCEPCDPPAKKHHCLLAGLFCCHKKPCAPPEQPAAEAGPPAGAITYPYYTVRGPRDYFAKSPTPIGP
jgi:hypothetical protein